MKIVLLFFCAIFTLLIALVLLLAFSKIKINVKEFNITNVKNGFKLKKLEKEVLIYLEFYLFGVIKIAKIKINKKLFKKINEKTGLESLEREAKRVKSVYPFKILKKLRLELENINLNLEIGTESVVLTAYLVAFISSVVRYNNCKIKSKRKILFSYASV